MKIKFSGVLAILLFPLSMLAQGRPAPSSTTVTTAGTGATFVYRGRVYSRRIPLFQDPGGVQALKTGFTREAGYNLAVSAWKSGQQFLLIVLGAQTRSLSFRDAKTVLRYGFFETGLESAPEPAPRRPVRPAPPRRSNQRGSRAAAGPVAG